MIFEDPEDLDCDGSCEDETTSHVPGKFLKPVEAPRAILVELKTTIVGNSMTNNPHHYRSLDFFCPLVL